MVQHNTKRSSHLNPQISSIQACGPHFIKLKNNLGQKSKEGPHNLFCKLQSEDVIRVSYEGTVRNDYFSFQIVSNHITKSAGLCAHGEKLYYVQ